MFLFFILSSARWPHLCSISQGTSGFGCFMTRCCSLERQCCDLKHGVRTVIYSCLWPKCCCCCSRWSLVLLWRVLRALWQSLAEFRAVPGFFISSSPCPLCAWTRLSPVSNIPTWLWCLLPAGISWAVCSVSPIDPFLALQPTLWIWVAGGRCTVLSCLRQFVWVTGRILCRMSCSQNCFLWCLLSFYTLLLCEFTCTAQNPSLRQLHSGVLSRLQHLSQWC